MRTVTDSLGLNPKVSEEELNQNILKGIARVAEVDTAIAKLESEQKVAMAKLQQNLEEVQVLLGTEEESITALNTEKDSLANTLKANRESSQTEAASLKSQLEQKNKELKKINVALGDSPDNIVAKMKALNKKKRDETDAKQRVEGELKSLKKKNRELQQSLDTEKAKTKQLEKKLEAPGSAGEESDEPDSSDENNREKAAA